MSPGRRDQPNSPQGHKREQLASTMQRELQNALARGLSDPRVRGLITVTEVEISPDGKDAVARVSVLPEEHEALTLHGLKAAAGKLRRDVGDRIRTRSLPGLRFEIDKGFKKQKGVMDALARDALEKEMHKEQHREEGAGS